MIARRREARDTDMAFLATTRFCPVLQCQLNNDWVTRSASQNINACLRLSAALVSVAFSHRPNRQCDSADA